ncbi:MAG: dTDP-4-dehydrorhamnose reductase [Flammeovirgaceae bacterium]|nr:dTDP-4-dehydrorhamnose reductase [Flammeovirgaceae bacterium]
MTSKILILGSNGQMGRASMRALTREPDAIDVVALGRELDICDHALVASKLKEIKPDIVLNTAAFTAVDVCEIDPVRAFATNATAVENLANVCSELGSALIHLSTDYVFGDEASAPIRESAIVAPLNVYGRSKADGERAIKNATSEHLIIRTSWIYGPDAGNFFATIMRLAGGKDKVTIVEDEASCPTLANDLADCLVRVCEHIIAGTATFGTFHVAGSQGVSRLDFARAIMKVRAELGLKTAQVEATTQAAYGAPARRPIDSRLDCTAFLKAYGTLPRGLDACLPSLIGQNSIQQSMKSRTD